MSWLQPTGLLALGSVVELLSPGKRKIRSFLKGRIDRHLNSAHEAMRLSGENAAKAKAARQAGGSSKANLRANVSVDLDRLANWHFERASALKAEKQRVFSKNGRK